MSPSPIRLRIVLAGLVAGPALLFGVGARAERSRESGAQPELVAPEGSAGREAAEGHPVSVGESPETLFVKARRAGRMMHYSLRDGHVRMLLDVALEHVRHADDPRPGTTP